MKYTPNQCESYVDPERFKIGYEGNKKLYGRSDANTQRRETAASMPSDLAGRICADQCLNLEEIKKIKTSTIDGVIVSLDSKITFCKSNMALSYETRKQVSYIVEADQYEKAKSCIIAFKSKLDESPLAAMAFWNVMLSQAKTTL